MNETFIENWNTKVRYNDAVYFLGDFAFCAKPKYAEIIQRLRGKIYLILGNHDLKMSRKFLDSQFVWVKDYHELRYKNNKICLFHYPMRTWNKSHFGSYHAFGHIHSKTKGFEPRVGLSGDVGVDSWGYEPVHVDEFIEALNHESK